MDCPFRARGLDIQSAPQRPNLTVMASKEVTYMMLLKNRTFLRFFLAQFVSSLGDWVGVIAIAIYATKIGGATGVGIVMTARVLPGFIVGPLAGVLADRWDRRKIMVTADSARAVLIFSLPFLPTLWWFLIVSIILESLTLVWGPAKDSSLPNFVPRSHLTHANSLSLMAVYAPWPLASVVYVLMATLGSFLGSHVSVLEGLHASPQALALWLDSSTFCFSAVMISTLSIPRTHAKETQLDWGQVKRDLVEGLVFVRDHKQVRPWMIGIALTFTAAGAVFSLGVSFVDKVLGGGGRGFSFLIGFLALGMIIGLLATGMLARRIQKDALFSSSILLLGAGLIGLASMGSLTSAIPLASALGFFGGIAYSSGYSLMHENTEDAVRGRTFSAAYTVIRIGTLGGLGLFPLLAGRIGDHVIAGYPLPGARATLWLAGLVAVGGGVLSMRAIKARQAASTVRPSAAAGYFVVFEGGEGAGKTTQMEALTRWLEARGHTVVVTREPGGTVIGAKIRELVLDPDAAGMHPRTEALLYAADRAQHAADVIAPALRDGKVVVSDRFVDSSLAYQGLARGLGLEEIYEISKWATGGLLPNLVLFLELDHRRGLDRLRRSHDRIESEGDDFHARVADAYRTLASKFPERFVVLDADKEADALHQEIAGIMEERAGKRLRGLEEERSAAARSDSPRLA